MLNHVSKSGHCYIEMTNDMCKITNLQNDIISRKPIIVTNRADIEEIPLQGRLNHFPV